MAYKHGSAYRANPAEQSFDDTVCDTCGTKLVEIKEGANLDFDDEQYFSFEGYCSAACAAHSVALANVPATNAFAERLRKRVALAEHSLRNARWNAWRQGRKYDQSAADPELLPEAIDCAPCLKVSP